MIEKKKITEYEKAEIKSESAMNSAIVGLSNSILSIHSIDDISFLILEYAKKITNSPFGYAGYIEKDSDYLVVSAITRNIWDYCKIKDKTIRFKKCISIPGQVINSGKPVLLNNFENNKKKLGVPDGHISIKRLLSVPAMIGDKVIGQISLVNSSIDYTDNDLNFVDHLSCLYAFAIERYLHNQEISRKQAQLIHAGRLTALGEMATAIAHELGQPLQIIRMASDVIGQEIEVCENNNNCEIIEHLKLINKQVERSSKIIQSIRDFSIQSSGVIHSRVDIKELFTKAINFFAEQFKSHGINFLVEIQKDNFFARLHPQKFQQLIVNLLSNARYAVDTKKRNFSEKYEKKISLRLLQKNDKILVEIEDNGIGMNENERKNCLTPFYTTKPMNEGTGLGLTIVANIIKEMNG